MVDSLWEWIKMITLLEDNSWLMPLASPVVPDRWFGTRYAPRTTGFRTISNLILNFPGWHSEPQRGYTVSLNHETNSQYSKNKAELLCFHPHYYARQHFITRAWLIFLFNAKYNKMLSHQEYQWILHFLNWIFWLTLSQPQWLMILTCGVKNLPEASSWLSCLNKQCFKRSKQWLFTWTIIIPKQGRKWPFSITWSSIMVTWINCEKLFSGTFSPQQPLNFRIQIRVQTVY